MAKKGMSITLLILVVALLVVVSSRITPKTAYGPEDVRTTDDPVTVRDDDPQPAAQQSVEVTPAPVDIRTLIPGVSTSDWNLKLVNNSYVLPSTFAPDVTAIGNGQYFDSRAVDALNAMLAGAEEAGFTTYVSAAYRPYSTQAYIFFGKASQIAWGGEVEYADAEILARETVAYPGTSEHQLGLAVDLLDSADTRMDAGEVANLPLLVWLREHCAEYGFIPRYPEDKKDITGWYEPWHFRYVGEECAAYITENGLCLEEFIALF